MKSERETRSQQIIFTLIFMLVVCMVANVAAIWIATNAISELDERTTVIEYVRNSKEYQQYRRGGNND